MKKVLIAVLVLAACLPVFLLDAGVVSSAIAGGGNNEAIVHAPIDGKDKESLQNGAKIYINNCLGCHSAKYLRYERMAEDLEIPKKIVEEEMIFSDAKIGDPMTNAMPVESAKKWFGTAPPDLSLEARLRGPDWVYSYLIGFHSDESRPWKVNNKVFKDVGMPHVLASMERELGEEAFHKEMADLTNFMDYMAEPIKQTRIAMAPWVLLFISVFGVLAYLLNKEYWKDVD